jgi:hypothetical protein
MLEGPNKKLFAGFFFMTMLLTQPRDRDSMIINNTIYISNE